MRLLLFKGRRDSKGASEAKATWVTNTGGHMMQGGPQWKAGPGVVLPARPAAAAGTRGNECTPPSASQGRSRRT